jgi:hypothetical protein
MKKKVVSLFLLIALTTAALGQQSPVAQFVVWKVEDGQLQNFENGYKKHLLWHKKNGDQNGWWGWFFVSGPRYGQFMDATFHHAWTDFDNAISPGEDMADNRLHVLPFARMQTIFKARHYTNYSIPDTVDNKWKITRMITVTVDDPEDGLKLAERLKADYSQHHGKSFNVYGIVDGGALNQFLILMGFSNWQEFGRTEDVSQKLYEFGNKERHKILSVVSETLLYRPDLSWFP